MSFNPYQHPAWKRQPQQQPQRYAIVIEGKDDAEPVVNRLKRWLKQGQRGFGLKCRSIEPVESPELHDVVKAVRQ